MIALTNYFVGGIVSIISLIILNFNSSLRSQYISVKSHVLDSKIHEIKFPNHLINSVVLIEDKRYYSHLGIDFYSIVRAFIKNISTSRLEGASTIVQQFVRSITGKREIKMKRKLNEIMLATLINNKFSKEEIIIAYLNTYRFSNCVGIIAFCQNEKYNLERITINESAQIAARLKYPYLHNTNYIKFLKRVRTIEKTHSHISSINKKLN